MLKCKCIY